MPAGVDGRFAGRRVIVTGGGSGIGRATALRLADEGAGVAILDKRADSAELVATEIKARGADALAVACDVASEADVAEAVSRAATTLGGIDGLFANAGTAGSGWIHETTLEDWESVLRVNLTGVFLAAKHAIPHLIEAGGGTIVTTGSIASTIVGPGGSAASYTASKGGVLQLTKQIAVDYAANNIRANCLCPGAVATELPQHVRADREGATTPSARLPRERFATPLNRVSSPEEQAAAVTFLLSSESSFITGTMLLVDGGLTAI